MRLYRDKVDRNERLSSTGQTLFSVKQLYLTGTGFEELGRFVGRPAAMAPNPFRAVGLTSQCSAVTDVLLRVSKLAHTATTLVEAF